MELFNDGLMGLSDYLDSLSYKSRQAWQKPIKKSHFVILNHDDTRVLGIISLDTEKDSFPQYKASLKLYDYIKKNNYKIWTLDFFINKYKRYHFNKNHNAPMMVRISWILFDNYSPKTRLEWEF